MAILTLRRSECEEDELPRECMCCGDPATNTKKKTFNWTPSWVIVIVLCSLLIGLIVMLMVQKRMTVHIPLCDRHRKSWRRRTMILTGTVLATVALGLGGTVIASQAQRGQPSIAGPILAVAFLGLLASLVLAVVFQQVSIRATQITDNDITLAGVSDEFIDTLKQERRARRESDFGDDGTDEAVSKDYEEKLRRRRERRAGDDAGN